MIINKVQLCVQERLRKAHYQHQQTKVAYCYFTLRGSFMLSFSG